MNKPLPAITAWLALLSSCCICAFAQSNTGAIRGSVLDPSGAAIPGAIVQIHNPVSHYDKSATTDGQGNFSFDNIPFNNYHVSVTAAGFQTAERDVNLRSQLPVEVKFNLKLGEAASEVTVEGGGGDLVETDSTAHTDVDRKLFEKLPLESQSSSLSSLVTLTVPGITADSNGLFHGMGDHAQNSFSVDGQPISDQQSKVFSNQIPLDSVQSLEVIQGAPPAEYGDKTSIVIVATTRSGLGVHPPHGDVSASYGSFGSSNAAFDLSYGGAAWGNFISLSGLNSGRFLDTPEVAVLHDHGNEQNVFDRIDLKPTSNDTFNLNLGFTRSWFQTPNSWDGQTAAAWSGLAVDNGGVGPDGVPVGSADQRSRITTFNVAPTWTRLVGAHVVATLGAFIRQDQFHYYPSDNPFADFEPGVQSQSIGQSRRLTNAGVRGDIAYVNGVHNIKIGALYQHTFLTEKDSFGIVDPSFNSVCLDAAGNPVNNASLTNPANCTGALQTNPAFVPLLGCYDLTRTGALPASDGCAASNSALHNYLGHTDVKELGLYVQDTINFKKWTFNLGIRGDIYNGLASATQAEPRLGVAYNVKKTSTVLRASYARSLETPFNENLILASAGCSDPGINALSTLQQGYPCLNSALRPGTRNEFHVGLGQAFSRYLVIDAEYIWKYTNLAYDFSVLGNTPITYPIEWNKSKIPGYAVRASVPNFHGLSAFWAFSGVAARFFTPQVSGIGTTPISSGTESVFRIDHDEKFNSSVHMQYQRSQKLPWIGFNWRYDGGLVAGPVPCAGGNCNNGPNGSDAVVDVSGLTPDQQYQAGLFCGGVHATPTTPISANGLCAASQYGSTLVQIPRAGTENDDHNPPRIGSRNLFDVSVGDDDLFNNDKHKWSARISVVNLTNRVALYNFLSTFSGTHYVSPRTVTATIGFHF